MITVMDSIKDSTMKKNSSCLDSQLWHACAGSMVQMPPIHSNVFYFPQGHLEHAKRSLELSHFHIPSMIPCRLSGIKYMADTETDEVYAQIKMIPLKNHDHDDANGAGMKMNDPSEIPPSFAKTLTQSDANNGGGFSVPRYCAETIFPRLDYTADPPVQTILAKDVHGQVWKFRHIYRGTPRRHLLTTGWSHFVNHKKLVAGDSIVFLRPHNGDLCLGIQRAKKGGPGGGSQSDWNPLSLSRREHDNKLLTRNCTVSPQPDSVIQAATLAANAQPFEVVYYPRATTPEFFVQASAVRAAMQIHWCSGMGFKMAFETEDSSRISWFMGTISSVHVADPVRWPNSPWRLLQVAWDEPDLLQNVKRVSPWLVELVSKIPTIHLSPFSPPRKKLRLPEHPEFSLFNQLPIPSFSSSSPFSAGTQGARHAQYGLSSSSSSDLYLKKLHSGLFPAGFQPPARIPSGNFMSENHENISCLLTMGNPTQSFKESNDIKRPHILLFGKLILPQQHSCQSCSGETIGNSSSEGNPEKTAISSDGSGCAVQENVLLENSLDEGSGWCKDHQKGDLGNCKVFMESDDVGRTLDLSALGSYEELYGKLAIMFGTGSSEMFSCNVLYGDASGSIKHTGDEPFSEFLKSARRLTILMDSGSDN